MRRTPTPPDFGEMRLVTGRAASEASHFQAVCDEVRDRINIQQYREALGPAQAAVEMTMRFVGVTHVQLAVALANLGFVYSKLSSFRRAIAAYEIAVEIVAQSPGGIGSARLGQYTQELQECKQMAFVTPARRQI